MSSAVPQWARAKVAGHAVWALELITSTGPVSQDRPLIRQLLLSGSWSSVALLSMKQKRKNPAK